MLLVAYVATLTLLLSCNKSDESEMEDSIRFKIAHLPKDTTTKPVVVPKDTTIIGEWLPDSKCRQDMLEKLVFANDTFYWYTKGFINNTPKIGQVAMVYVNIKNFVSDTINDHQYFEVKNGRIFLYQNWDHHGQNLIEGYILQNDFQLFLNNPTSLNFAGWTYTRK